MPQPSSIRVVTESALAAALAAYGSGGSNTTTTTRTASFTLTTADHNSIQLVDATAGHVTVTLPSTTTPGIVITLKKTDATANIVTIAGPATVDGLGGYGMNTQNQFLVVVSTAVANTWRSIGSNQLVYGPQVLLGTMAFGDGINISTGTTTGTKIGTATTQKLGFFNATPVVQQAAATELGLALSNLGLRAAGAITDITVADGGTGRSTSTTAYGVLAAGTTATGAHQTIAPGTSGHFLKSAGAAALGAFAAIGQSDVTNLVTDLAAKAPLASPTFTGTVTLPNTVQTGSARETLGALTTTVTLTTSSQRHNLVDGSAAAFTATLPVTTTPGIVFEFTRIDNTSANAVTLAGTFYAPSGNITNLKMYGVNQKIKVATTSTSGLYYVLESSPVLVPSGTAHANLPDGTLFVEYTP